MTKPRTVIVTLRVTGLDVARTVMALVAWFATTGPAFVVADDASGQVNRQLSTVGSQIAADPLDRPIEFSDRRPASASESIKGNSASTSRATSTVIGSLAVCLGAFLIFVWATKRTASRGLSALPNEVVELLGRVPLATRQQLQLIRLGKSLVLVAVSPNEVSTLTTITDPAEVERLTSLCQQTKPNSATSAFREVLGQYAQESTTPGFVGDGRQSDYELASRSGRRRPTRRESEDA